MSGRLRCVVLDCPDSLELAGFYREVLGGEVTAPDPGLAVGAGSAVLRDADGPVLAFQDVADHRPPVWGAPEQQFLLDIRVEDPAAAHETVLALGAVALGEGGGDGAPDGPSWRVYADPAGHPFRLMGA
ncbi:VOC family protein [Streptomyces omiyaensis]|uniref:VOC family protein n=1 Tax=Streptomyces omiyaensis TaxID=68247 RepID=A0ABW7BS39_9ACTN|nr:VOC family protein [Streptomyces omiyaensis]GGY37526.1 glyoxalase [Streptomyces omiyaensis]